MFTEGMMFDRYKLIKLLGRGGFSEVWLAKDDKWTGLQVAIKIYAPGMGLDEDGVNMFIEEFKLVFDLTHTNLLRPTHFDCWERQPYLILPYCSQGSTFKYIKNHQSMPEKECWQMIHDVASGLAYMHEKTPPLVHQDIKPDNILINDEGRYMITDFGISTRVRSTIRNGQSQEQSGGTMAYMGPECFSAKPKPIMAGDIWSMGAMMYELITGTPPFGNHGGVLQKNGAEIPIIEENYSQELKDLIYSMLTKETWKRPSAKSIEEIAYNKLHGLPLNIKATVPAAMPPTSDQSKPQDMTVIATPQTDSRATVIRNPQFNSNPTVSGITPAPKPAIKKWWYAVGIGIIALICIIVGIATCGGSDKEESTTITLTDESFDSEALQLLNEADSLLEKGKRFMVAHEDALYDADNGCVEENFLNANEKYIQILIQKDKIQNDVITENATKGRKSAKEILISIREGLIQMANSLPDEEYAKPLQDRAQNINAKLEQ